MILGTSGHVDHGKTSLVKALTGIDTDRLPEEKRRGITLELGFAHLTLPSGRVLGVIDVPGHERFVKAMAAGAGGVDLACLVVAGDEGVMPQTREHLDILGLLGVRAGVLVLSKADLLEGLGEEWRQLVEQDVRALARGTFLEGAPVVPVSSRTGLGLPELLKVLDAQAAGLAERSFDGPLFLPVDRAFTVKGFGTVVTGSLLSGQLRLEAEVALAPGGAVTRVRGLQRHGQQVQQAAAGQRIAVNLPGVEVKDVARGMAVVEPQVLPAVRAMEVELTLLASVEEPLKRRTRALVSLGTGAAQATVTLWDRQALEPGETCFAQVRFTAPVAAVPGQRFIVRGTRQVAGHGTTVAGGRVLSLNPPRRRKDGGAALAGIAAEDVGARLAWLVREAGPRGITQAELKAQAQAAAKDVVKALDVGTAQRRWHLVDREARRYVGADVFEALQQRLVARLERFHLARPEEPGMPLSALREQLGTPPERVFHRALEALEEAGRVERGGEWVRQHGKGGRVVVEDSLSVSVLEALAAGGLAPPTPGELMQHFHQEEKALLAALNRLVRAGAVVRCGELYFETQAVRALEEKVRAYLAEHPRLDTAALKQLIGQSRKFLIPLAEHLDAAKVTLRVGDVRVLRGTQSS